MKRHAAPLLAALISPFFQPVFGQAKMELEEIVVEATRLEVPLAKTPFAVGVVKEQRIQTAQQQLSLDESMQPDRNVYGGLTVRKSFGSS